MKFTKSQVLIYFKCQPLPVETIFIYPAKYEWKGISLEEFE